MKVTFVVGFQRPRRLVVAGGFFVFSQPVIAYCQPDAWYEPAFVGQYESARLCVRFFVQREFVPEYRLAVVRFFEKVLAQRTTDLGARRRVFETFQKRREPLFPVSRNLITCGKVAARAYFVFRPAVSAQKIFVCGCGRIVQPVAEKLPREIKFPLLRNFPASHLISIQS